MVLSSFIISIQLLSVAVLQSSIDLYQWVTPYDCDVQANSDTLVDSNKYYLRRRIDAKHKRSRQVEMLNELALIDVFNKVIVSKMDNIPDSIIGMSNLGHIILNNHVSSLLFYVEWYSGFKEIYLVNYLNDALVSFVVVSSYFDNDEGYGHLFSLHRKQSLIVYGGCELSCDDVYLIDKNLKIPIKNKLLLLFARKHKKPQKTCILTLEDNGRIIKNSL